MNSSNTCVGWDRTHLHGTGRYESGLEHVGLAILSSSNTNRVERSIKLESRTEECRKMDFYGILVQAMRNQMMKDRTKKFVTTT